MLPDPIMISERPAEANDRAVPGHWEGDLLLGTPTTAIGTLVERSTRYVMLFTLARRPRAQAVREGIAASIVKLPLSLRRSLTWDQGAEMSQHQRFTVETGVAIYFCDPGHPWQRYPPRLLSAIASPTSAAASARRLRGPRVAVSVASSSSRPVHPPSGPTNSVTSRGSCKSARRTDASRESSTAVSTAPITAST